MRLTVREDDTGASVSDKCNLYMKTQDVNVNPTYRYSRYKYKDITDCVCGDVQLLPTKRSCA